MELNYWTLVVPLTIWVLAACPLNSFPKLSAYAFNPCIRHVRRDWNSVNSTPGTSSFGRIRCGCVMLVGWPSARCPFLSASTIPRTSSGVCTCVVCCALHHCEVDFVWSFDRCWELPRARNRQKRGRRLNAIILLVPLLSSMLSIFVINASRFQ